MYANAKSSYENIYLISNHFLNGLRIFKYFTIENRKGDQTLLLSCIMQKNQICFFQNETCTYAKFITYVLRSAAIIEKKKSF